MFAHAHIQLAGILKPYDGQCYLERDDSTVLPIEYTRWNEFVSISSLCEKPPYEWLELATESQ